MYHVEHNFTNDEVAFLRNILKTAKEGTAWHVSEEKLIPTGIWIRHTTSDKRVERTRREYNLYGNSKYGMKLWVEDENLAQGYTNELPVGATNAPRILIERFKSLFGIDLKETWPNIGNQESALLLAIEGALFANNRQAMKDHKITIGYCLKEREVLPYTFFSAKSAEAFIEKYTRESGINCTAFVEGIRNHNMAGKDDFQKLAAILKNVQFKASHPIHIFDK